MPLLPGLTGKFLLINQAGPSSLSVRGFPRPGPSAEPLLLAHTAILPLSTFPLLGDLVHFHVPRQKGLVNADRYTTVGLVPFWAGVVGLRVGAPAQQTCATGHLAGSCKYFPQ